jgi:hypothetical protein
METNTQKMSKKDRKKVVRSVIQILILLSLIYLTVVALFWSKTYKPYQENDTPSGGGGFIALSYFGVDYTGSDTLISTERLREHLNVLKASGYVTITQQDILDYYESGKKLPEKALFLFFEDGRRDTAVNAQNILEDCNYKASMLSYANNLNKRNYQFLSADDLLELERTSFWELGTNGYRLSYINIFDRHENYLGEMTPEDYFKISQYVKREYNHYLMDFIRDENDVPMESFQQMQERIAGDYEAMKQVYDEKAGGLPRLYTLMHSNTGQYATNDKVSVENEMQIGKYFAMNFNREMYCYNDTDSIIYDLTRMQPQPYWSKNHLLMRIWGDTKEKLAFVVGDSEKASKWDLELGAAEFDDDIIYLTSLPEGEGVVRLKDSNYASDFTLSANFNGNKLGTQSVDFGVSENRDQYLAVEIKNNVLFVYEKRPDADENILFTLNLDVHDGIEYKTWEEDRQEAMEAEIEAKLEQKYQPEESLRIAEELKNDKEDTSQANNETYIPGIDIKTAGSREVTITRSGNKITVSIDNKVAVKDLAVDIPLSGDICLRSAWGEYGYSQRNLADDVYDGVFKSLVIREYTGKDPEEEKVLFDNRLSDWDNFKLEAEQVWKSVSAWFMKAL